MYEGYLSCVLTKGLVTKFRKSLDVDLRFFATKIDFVFSSRAIGIINLEKRFLNFIAAL